MSDDPIAIARVGLARALPRILALPGAPARPGRHRRRRGLRVPDGGRRCALGPGRRCWPWRCRGRRGHSAHAAAGGRGGRSPRPLAGGWPPLPAGPRRRHPRHHGRRGRSAIRTRFGFLGWAYGRAILRGEEPISIVRLAPTPTVILVPTDHGRLAIAAASEPELLEALGAAARVQQRLDEVSGRVLAALPARRSLRSRARRARGAGAGRIRARSRSPHAARAS